MGSERRADGLSAGARRALEALLAGRTLDEAAPRGSSARAEVEAHLTSVLEGAASASAGTRVRHPAKAAATSAPAAPSGVPVAYSDGASRGNPGPAAIGIHLHAKDGSDLWREGRRIGRATNNVAEYRGAIAALTKARELGLDELELRMDSELVVKQLRGEYRVKDARLAELKAELDALLPGFRKVRIRHVPREQNRVADGLANEALDGE